MGSCQHCNTCAAGKQEVLDPSCTQGSLGVITTLYTSRFGFLSAKASCLCRARPQSCPSPGSRSLPCSSQQQVWLVPMGPCWDCSDTLLPCLSLPWDVFSRDQILLLCLQGAEVIVTMYQILKYFLLFSLLSLDFFFWLQFPLFYGLYVPFLPA